MESEAVAVLKAIKFDLDWLIVAVIAALCVTVFRLWLFLRVDKADGLSKAFRIMAEDLFEKGEFKELIELCESRLKTRPNQAHALWFLGRSQYAQENYVAAKTTFEKLARVEPNWDAGYVRIYLDRIESQSQF